MAEYEPILSDLYDGLATLTKGRYEIDENTELSGDLDIDSLKMMELLLDIEDRFDISVPMNVLSDVKTVKELALEIEKLTRCNG